MINEPRGDKMVWWRANQKRDSRLYIIYFLPDSGLMWVEKSKVAIIACR